MAPILKSTKEMKIVGIEIRTTNLEEMNSGAAKIPGLWGPILPRSFVVGWGCIRAGTDCHRMARSETASQFDTASVTCSVYPLTSTAIYCQI